MGFIHKVSRMIPYVGPALNRKQYREIEWWGNSERINYHLKKIVHGPKQECYWKAHYDCVGKCTISDSYKKVCIKKVYDPDGNIVKIYDTDRRVVIGRVEDDYSKGEDMENMLELVENTKSTKERNTIFIENQYKIDGIHEHQREDRDF